jgi:hypothetical protein
MPIEDASVAWPEDRSLPDPRARQSRDTARVKGRSTQILL